jgi:phosphoglycolate phosphatase-like HAD superfamily hydrolase
MNKNAHKALLFDIDGTLLNAGSIDRLSCQRALEDMLGYSTPKTGVEMDGKTYLRIAKELLIHAGIEGDQIEAQTYNLLDAINRHFAEAAPSAVMQLLPGVRTLLDRLEKDTRYVLGLVTGNVHEMAVQKLEAVGIDPAMFTFGAFGDDHIDRNILPEMALNRINQSFEYPVPPEKALIIGDTPYDITCAHHTGVKVLGVATGVYVSQDLAKYEPDFLLEDLSNTSQVLEILENF